MWRKKVYSLLLTLILAMSCMSANAETMDYVESESGIVVTRASGRFTMDIPGHTSKKASTSFPLEVGEVVTIKASYAPFSANVDFGLIAPNGHFYYFTITDGSINKAIKITKRGYYTFAVRNNSSYSVNVSGYVNY